MTEEQKEDIKLLKELIADTSIPNDDREIYQEALNQILAETKSDMPKVAKEKMPKKEKATPKTKPSKKPKAEKTTALPSDVDAMKKAIKERTGKTEAECEDIIAQYRKLRAKAKVNNAKRTEKLKSNDDLITGTNVITPVAQIEKDAEIVKEKIEKQVEQIENKAEREVVKKDKTKDEVKVEVEQKVVKQLAKLSDDMVSSATTFVKNIQSELKKVDKTEAKNFLLGLRNEIDALLSKFADGGVVQTYNVTENMSASSVNPSKFAMGGSVGNPSKKKMLDYLNMYFDNYSELRTIAIEEDNILTRRMLNSLDNEELQMAYDDAKYEIKAETQFARGGGVTKTKTGAIKLYYHQTSGGAEYLSSSKVKGTKDEGSMDSEYIVRIDGAKDFGGELFTKVLPYAKGGGVFAKGKVILFEENGVGGNKNKTYQLIKFDYTDGSGDEGFEIREMPTNTLMGQGNNFKDVLDTYNLFIEKNIEYARGGGVRIGSDGREYPFGSAWALEHNKHNKNEKYEIPKSSRKS